MTRFGWTTLSDKYGNHFTTAFYYEAALTPSTYHRSGLRISAHSPIQLVITDPQGRRVGYDPRTNTLYNEIPDVAYVTGMIIGPNGDTLPEFKYVLIPEPLYGSYQAQAIGSETGSYEITAERIDGSVVSKWTFDGVAQANSSNSFSIPGGLFLPFIRK